MFFVQYLIPCIEIAIIAVMLNYLLSFFWNTRAMDLLFGLIAFLVTFAFASWLHFPVLETLLHYIVNVIVLAILIIFQPEIRIALSRLSMKGKHQVELSEHDRFLEQLTNIVYRFAEKHVGALILLENHDSLEEYANNAVRMDAIFTPELLETIFMTNTPLHDGAVIIRGTTIISASTILPLADDTRQITRSMGTRHRAGLGISQITDALIIIVSEETGKISVAREGIMTRGVKMDRFKGILRSIFMQPKERSRFFILEWLRRSTTPP